MNAQNSLISEFQAVVLSLLNSIKKLWDNSAERCRYRDCKIAYKLFQDNVELAIASRFTFMPFNHLLKLETLTFAA